MRNFKVMMSVRYLCVMFMLLSVALNVQGWNLPSDSLTKARLAEAAYGDDKFVAKGGFERVGGDKRFSGLQYAVYERTVNGQKERVLAFAGTQFPKPNDTIADVVQALVGVSWQYEQGIKVALNEKIKANATGASLSMVGHSLGGGIAQNASAQTSIPATVFEAAGIGTINSLVLEIQDLLGTIGQDPDDAPVDNISMPWDPVHWWGDHFGESHELPGFPDGFGAIHGMAEVVKRLENSGVVDSWWDMQLRNANVTAGQLDRLPQAQQDILRRLAHHNSFNQLEKHESIVAAQFDNLQRFQVGAFLNAPVFVFTTPESTGGFSDVEIPANALFRVRLFDSGNLEDGDIVDVILFSGANPDGDPIGSVRLTFAGQEFDRQIAPGPVELRLTALNEGTSSPNTGGVQILSDVISGPKNQNFNLYEGETGVLRVLAK